MLVLTRKSQETLLIDGGRIKVTVLEIKGSNVRIGIEAPREVAVDRGEVWLQRQSETQNPVTSSSR